MAQLRSWLQSVALGTPDVNLIPATARIFFLAFGWHANRGLVAAGVDNLQYLRLREHANYCRNVATEKYDVILFASAGVAH